LRVAGAQSEKRHGGAEVWRPAEPWPLPGGRGAPSVQPGARTRPGSPEWSAPEELGERPIDPECPPLIGQSWRGPDHLLTSP
jgi:hypothetical protein